MGDHRALVLYAARSRAAPCALPPEMHSCRIQSCGRRYRAVAAIHRLYTRKSRSRRCSTFSTPAGDDTTDAHPVDASA